MGLLEEHALPRKSVDVGSLRLRMSAEAADPVVQIVNCNEKNVWTSNCGGRPIPFCLLGRSGWLNRFDSGTGAQNKYQQKT